MTGSNPADTFPQEAQDLLDQLEQALLDLEHTPDNRDLVDTAFRALHTIKGSGSMFGFEHVADFTHNFETAFDRVRKGQVPVTPNLVAVALAAKDHIRTLIEQHPSAESAPAGEPILADLRAIVQSPDAPVATAAAPTVFAAPAGLTQWRIRFRLPGDALVRGNNPLLLLDELRTLGETAVVALTDAVPTLDVFEAEGCYLGWDVTLSTTQPRSAIDDVFIFVADDMDLQIEQIGAASEPPAVQAAAVDAGKPGAEPTIAREIDANREASKANTSLRVPAERLDELMDRVGELVIAQARLTQLAGAGADVAIKSVAEEIQRLSSGLRDITMSIRMVPIGSLFGRFRRLVHDLSRDLNKGVELVTSGEETELDKTMIERLADPLVHLIRNAIDHGLEDPAGRSAAGKPERGQVKLLARHSGAEVLISIVDDGRGLDRDRIRAKAEEQGLLAPGTTMSDGELFQFLFHPGFSTAKEITAVSGRGVGMDVVKRTIESLRGTIDITTQAGRGTEMTLRLPLTLAIIEGLLVRVGTGRYAIPLSAVEECVELSAVDDGRSKGRNFLNIRDELVPFIRLRDLFSASSEPDPYQKIVIVSSGDLRVGLVVDQIIGSHQTVIKSLSKLHADVETFSGATILGDGMVALILDIAHLVEFGQSREERLKAS